ncbi:GNAT family N-acetyltransferase [Curtobacterium ammoniigenes]|uniref:GNAT family N-acetyltransferase n=1 Tax=Curtobacterium ammoniigenes TaxID=395387 RepID=UPI000834E180|nr:GNAT family protein [Curtobacterium ammoniigenes]
MATTFGHDLGDGWSITLRDLTTVEPIFALIEANLDRLRAAEPWAWTEHEVTDVVLHTEHLLAKYGANQALPCVIRKTGEVVGVATLSIDPYLGSCSLGYWIDAAQEGRGGVRRACTALLGVARARGLARAEIRAAARNQRSRALAERLGFTLEGLLRSAMPLGPNRVDVAVYGLLLGD